MTHEEKSQVGKAGTGDTGRGGMPEGYTASNQKLAAKRPLSRRDLIVAGIGGLAGVATGAVGTVVTTYVQERARANLASNNLVVYPEAIYQMAGAWAFYSRAP